VLDERLTARSLTGAVLILAGIAVIELVPAPAPVSVHPQS